MIIEAHILVGGWRTLPAVFLLAILPFNLPWKGWRSRDLTPFGPALPIYFHFLPAACIPMMVLVCRDCLGRRGLSLQNDLCWIWGQVSSPREQVEVLLGRRVWGKWYVCLIDWSCLCLGELPNTLCRNGQASLPRHLLIQWKSLLVYISVPTGHGFPPETLAWGYAARTQGSRRD